MLETVFICEKSGELKPDLTITEHFVIRLSYLSSYLQHSLQSRAGGFFVLVKGVGVDVERGGGLAVAEDTRHCGDIRAARDHQAGGGVPEGMDIRLLQQRFHFGGEVHIAVTRAGLGLFCKYLLVSYYS